MRILDTSGAGFIGPHYVRIMDGQDAVVHFAAETHVDRSITAAAEFVRANVEGAQALLDACLAAASSRWHVS